MEIKPYSDEYDEDVKRLVAEFHKEALNGYGLVFDKLALDNTLEMLKQQAFLGSYTLGYLAIIDGKAEGILAGKEVKIPASSVRVWHEMIWFMSEKFRKFGVKLFKDTRKMLKAQGFDAMVMVHMHTPNGGQISRLYERLGLVPMETNYIGRL
jgi:hypothetical protein